MSPLIRRSTIVAAVLGSLAALSLASTASADRGARTTIYTETNVAGANSVLAFQEVGGSLAQVGSYPTGGNGSGASLGSQGAVVVEDHHLLAVNAGSNDVSLFEIGRDGSLHLADVEASGGAGPTSITVHDDVVYVLNATSGDVSGFRLHDDRLVPIPGSTRALSGAGGAQVSFDTTGTRLVVTEKATNTIDVFRVDRRGVAGAAIANPSAGATPFGFAIDRRNHVIVSNAAGGAAGASSLSSYSFAKNGSLAPVTTEAATTQTAACWVALSGNGKYAFTTNAGSGTISSYRIGHDGSLTLVQAVAATPGAGPIDMVSVDGSLFTLAGGSHVIARHLVAGNGSLTAAGEVAVPAGVQGLAAA